MVGSLACGFPSPESAQHCFEPGTSIKFAQRIDLIANMTRVGTGGPCAHCGRVSSPCWRKGPPEKPLLCNACGARFLVKHSLEGYIPNAKPLAKRESASGPKPKKEAGLRALAAMGRPQGEKRKRTLSKRCVHRLLGPGLCGYFVGWPTSGVTTQMLCRPPHRRLVCAQ